MVGHTQTIMVDDELDLSVNSSMRELNCMVTLNKISRIDTLINKVYKSIHQHNRMHHKILYELNDMSIKAHNVFRMYIS